MKEQIVSNQHYSIHVDSAKNRVYAEVKGFWDIEVMKDYRSQLNNSLRKVKQNFTMVADLKNLKTLPPEVAQEQKESMRDITKAGIYKVAEIIPQSAVTNMQVNSSARETNIQNNKFSSVFEAEAWLDNEVRNM